MIGCEKMYSRFASIDNQIVIVYIGRFECV